jgi:hypothetical protein
MLIAFPAVLYPTYLLLEALFGRGLAAATDFGNDFYARLPLLIPTMLGYTMMMYVYVARGTFRDVEALCQVLRGGEATSEKLGKRLTWFGRRRLWVGGLIGFAFACVLYAIEGGSFVVRLPDERWLVRVFYSFLILSAFWITAGLGAVYLIDSARLYSRVGERQVVVDLLDLGPLSPLAQHGLRIVLLLMIIPVATVTGYFMGSPSVSRSTVVVLFLGCSWYVPLAVAAFLLPVRGLRRHIRARKAEKLTQLRDDIRRNEELVRKAGPESAEAGGRLPGLMVLEKRIESVREWPFDAPTLTRFFLYVAIPLGSWVGGALVERLLGAALD